MKFVPVDNWIAAKSVMLPGKLHDDPADRMIIATALASGATLVTNDKRIRNYMVEVVSFEKIIIQ